MRKLVVFAAVVASVGATSAQAGTLTIAVTSVVLSAKQTDVLPNGASKGDTIEMRDRLLNLGDLFSFVHDEPPFGPGRFDTFNPPKALLRFPMQKRSPRARS